MVQFTTVTLLLLLCALLPPLASCGGIPPVTGIDLNSCASTSFTLPGNSTEGFEWAWGGGATQCYANLVGNLSQIYSFTFYLAYNEGSTASPNAFGYVFDWTHPATFFVSQPVPIEELNLANNTNFPNFVPVTATFASPQSLNARYLTRSFFFVVVVA